MFIKIDKLSDMTMTRQIYSVIKDSILRGDFVGNQKLPSTRVLSLELDVSRIVAVDAYEQLLAEGYVYSIEGAGTYVNEGVLLESEYIPNSEMPDTRQLLYEEEQNHYNFRTGVPDLRYVPIEDWTKLYKQTVRTLDFGMFDYHNPMGYYPLRNAIVDYAKRWRGIQADSRQIVIINGAAQGFSLLRAFVEKESYILIENPVSTGIITTLNQFGAQIKSINVDENGMITSELPEQAPRLIFTTPSHQFPTGGVMPVNRRIELIGYAKRHDCYIVEDDYDSEFRYEGEPIQALQGLEPSRVIYLGTFSKTLCPAIRLGFMIVPRELIKTIEEVKYNSDIHTSLFEQATMASFISQGYYEKHIRKMKKLYDGKRRMIIQEIQKHFGNKIVITGHKSGLHLILDFSEVIDRYDLEKAMKSACVNMQFLDAYCFPRETCIGEVKLVMGFGNVTESQIVDGLEKLSDEIKRYKTGEA